MNKDLRQEIEKQIIDCVNCNGTGYVNFPEIVGNYESPILIIKNRKTICSYCNNTGKVKPIKKRVEKINLKFGYGDKVGYLNNSDAQIENKVNEIIDYLNNLDK